MKLRLTSHSVRFRLTTEEIETLDTSSRVQCETVIPSPPARPAILRFAIETGAESESLLALNGEGLMLKLSREDMRTLRSHGALYLRREWLDEQGNPQRTAIYVEKDAERDKTKVQDGDPNL